MVGFRNIAVHDYQALQLPITVRIITDHLDEFLAYSKALLSTAASSSRSIRCCLGRLADCAKSIRFCRYWLIRRIN